jgi:tRNA A37 methylthiotransferase MiaB
MKTKGNKKTKVNIVTLGCSKNLVDSEVLLTQLRGNGIDAVHEAKEDDASVVVINTCGFIDNAKQESIDTILRYVDAKEEGIVDKVYVSRNDIKTILKKKYRMLTHGSVHAISHAFSKYSKPIINMSWLVNAFLQIQVTTLI